MGADAGFCENYACCPSGALVKRWSGDVMELEIKVEKRRFGIGKLNITIIPKESCVSIHVLFCPFHSIIPADSISSIDLKPGL